MPTDKRTWVAIFFAFIIVAALASAFTTEETPKINSTIEDSKAALEWINDIRIDNGSAAIEFDERAYWLALHQCKDMEEYNYYYHTNPDTLEWVGIWKSEYGFSESEYPVDNLACDTLFTYIDYNDESKTKEILNSAFSMWFESYWHNYNLLYPYHKSGAVVVYRDTVVFIGVNEEGYGSEYLEPLGYSYDWINERYYKGY